MGHLGLSVGSAPAIALFFGQFVVALADNALLIVAFALLGAAQHPGATGMLQQAFVMPFVLLAPFVGPLADSMPKGRVMLATTALKLGAAACMALGANPILAYALSGIGAAAYSPAKYGILTQMFGPAELVRANALMETATVLAVLLGVPLGGLLVDRYGTATGFVVILLAYLSATLLLLLVPRLPPEHPLQHFDIPRLAEDFNHSVKELWADGQARFTLLGTSLFWASGTALRLLLIAWVPAALGVHDSATPAQLMAVVALGIAVGAVIASLALSTRNAWRAAPAGLVLGPLVMALSLTESFWGAALWLGLLGLSGGFFVVPLNALLQDRGHATVGTGRALAVQNFAENVAMLGFVGLLMGGQWLEWPVTRLVVGYGLMVLIGMQLINGLGRRYRVRAGSHTP